MYEIKDDELNITTYRFDHQGLISDYVLLVDAFGAFGELIKQINEKDKKIAQLQELLGQV